MLVVNLFGAPGSGKSTGAAYIFSRLKMLGVNAELVTEFAKDLAWEERRETFKNEIYLFAKQHHRLFRLKDKVDVVVTDRPLLLSVVYNGLYGFNAAELDALVRAETAKFDNMNFLIQRAKPYNPAGRNQTEAESADIHTAITRMLYEYPYTKRLGTMAGYDMILDTVLERLESPQDAFDGALRGGFSDMGVWS